MSSDLDLRLPAHAENVIVIRQAIAGLAEAVGMDPRRVADLKTVVTEAANNVVVHAYEGEGPIEVDVEVGRDRLEITVRDRGRGFRPSAADAAASLGLGLPLIAALSDEFAIRGGSGRGTSLSVRFALAPAAERERGREESAAGEGLRLEVDSGELVRPVLARILGALAARADFSVDRLSDTMLLGDAVSEHRPADFRGGRVAIAISDDGGALDIRVGPLNEGGGERLLSGMEIPGDGGSLRALARSIEVERRDDAEYLVLEVAG
ncbi:MAG: ATP-binding protein [Solirubrobacterales bacterium]